MLVSSMTIIAHNSLCSTRAYHLRIDLALIPLLENVVFQKNPMITQDLSNICIATRGESVSTYPRRPKEEASSDTVDVVERLRDPTDPSTERTTPPRSAHVQLDDVPRTLDPVDVEGEFRQHDGVVTVMMQLPTSVSYTHLTLPTN